MSPTLEQHAEELGQFVAGADDVCAIAWDRKPQPRLMGAAGGCLRVFGVDAKTLRGLSAGDLFAGGERAARDLTEASDAESCSVPRLLVRIGGATQGQQFNARLTLRSVKGGTVALVRDLTISWGESDAILRAADLSRFASLLAHEIRNPLSAVKIALQTLEKHGRLHSNDLRRAEIAVREVGNIEVLLSEVLEFARPPSLSRVPVDPRGPVREVVEKLAPEWSQRGITVRVQVPERMSPVHADPTRLATAARLLIRSAALAAEEEGGGEVVVTLRELVPEGKTAKKKWELAVRDPGRTLSPEAREQAFVPFHPSRARGSGVALAVVDRIAREHGGSVLLSEVPGGGNRVTLTLPQD